MVTILHDNRRKRVSKVVDESRAGTMRAARDGSKPDRLHAAKKAQQKLDGDLIDAAKAGEARWVRMLVAEGAAVDARDKNGWTPLMRAALMGHEDIARFLVEKGAQVNAREDFRGWTASALAGFAGHDRIRTMLMEHGGEK